MSVLTNTFPSACRLQKGSGFSAVFQAAQRKSGRYVTVFYKSPELIKPETLARLGVSVAKRYFKKAHDRNRWKRLVRESFRTHKAVLSPLEIVVVVRAEAQQCSNQEFLAALEKVWRKF